MGLLPGNLLSENNQSVETSVGNWGGFAPGSSTVLQSTLQAYDGANAVQCTRNATASPDDMCSLISGSGNPTGLKPAEKYEFYFWVFTTKVGAVFQTNLGWYNGATFISQSLGPTVTPTASTWTLVTSGPVAAPAATTQAETYIRANSGMALGDIAYFDGMFFGVPRDQVKVITLQALNRASRW